MELMRRKIDDEMGFEKVDDEMGCDKIDDDAEYVKVEKIDADVPHVDADMAYKKKNVDADMAYEHKVGTDMESEHKVDADMAYNEKVDDMEYEHKVDADMEYEKEDELLNILPYPYVKRRGDMDLQDVVKESVLPFLPAKSLFRFSCISKEWDRWIRSPLFAHYQSGCFTDLSGYFCQYGAEKHSFVSLDNMAYGVPFGEFLPQNVNIISSCSGLLLCHGRDASDRYYICNPATKDWAALPCPELCHGDEPSTVLAFEPSGLNIGADYQLICAIPAFEHVMFELYSSETSSWKISNAILVDMEESRIEGTGFYMKGVAYMETSARNVIAFHLSAEVYEVIPLPSGTPQGGVLTKVEGEVGYIGLSRSENDDYSVMIYMGMDLGLRHKIDLTIMPEWPDLSQDVYRPLPCPDGKSLMILVGNIVYRCSLGGQSVTRVGRVGRSRGRASLKYLAYVNSLVEVAKPSVSVR